jgi:hypothetical protein
MNVKSRIEMQLSVSFIAREEREIETFSILSIELDGFVAVYISVLGSTGQQETMFHPDTPLNRGCKYQEYNA